MRSDALENRKRLLETATAVMCEHGLEFSVAEIADAAGVGRGTFFRNFPTKDALIAAVVSEAMLQTVASSRERLASSDQDSELVFKFITEMVSAQQANRAVLELVSEEFFDYPEIREAHDELLDVLADTLARGQSAGSIRPEVTPMDVMVLIKGICMNPAALEPSNPDVMLRHVELIRAAISTPAFARPLRGTSAQMPH